MHEIDINEIEDILAKFRNKPEEISRLLEAKYFSKDRTAAVLGVDIYKYSEYANAKQLLIPLIFHDLLRVTLSNCLSHSRFFFQGLNKDAFFKESFIDMGDGGFVIFENPVQALFFSFFFESNLRLFNAGNYLPDYGDFVGRIELRYALTYDGIYMAGQNHYGASIINNARILGKDKLNRFLYDQSTHEWFLRHYGGIECVRVLQLADYQASEPFKSYKPVPTNDSQFFMYDKASDSSLVDALQVMKIGQISSKSQKLNIYSLFVQLTMAKKISKDKKMIVISIGNHNVSGLNEP